MQNVAVSYPPIAEHAQNFAITHPRNAEYVQSIAMTYPPIAEHVQNVAMTHPPIAEHVQSIAMTHPRNAGHVQNVAKALNDRPFLKSFGITADSPKLVIFRITHGQASFWTMENNLKPKEYIEF